MPKSIVATAMLLGVAAGAAADTTAPRFITLTSSDMLSSNVVGLVVYDMNNNDLGKIQDVAFDANRTVKGFVLSVGGVLGMGAHYVAVDPGSVIIKYGNSDKKWHANMNSSVGQVKSAPEFKYEGEWTASKT